MPEKQKMKVAVFTDTMDRRAMGTALYTRKLVEHLASLQEKEHFELFLVHSRQVDDALYQAAREILMPRIKLPKFSRFLSEALFLWNTRNDFDIIHYPQESNYPLFFLTRAKIVVTVHSHIEGWRQFGLYRRYLLIYWMMRFFKWRISRFIAVSHSTAKNIQGHFSIPEEKIVIAYEGVGEEYFSEKPKDESQRLMKEKYGLVSPYVLNGSRIDPHKNVPRVIEAFCMLREKAPITHTLIIGEKHWPSENEKVEKLIAERGLAGCVLHKPYIEPEHMPDLYRAADCFIFPSLHEGFGLPIVESLAVGTPVITSNIFSMPEILGGHGFLVDPYSAPQMAEALRAVLNGGADVRSKIESGRRWARAFDWVQMAQKTLSVYRAL